MKKIIIAAAAALALVSCAPKHQFSGHFDNLGKDSMIVMTFDIESLSGIGIDTVALNNGSFTYDSGVDKVAVANFFTMEENWRCVAATLTIPGQNAVIEGDGEISRMSGGPFYKELQKFVDAYDKQYADAGNMTENFAMEYIKAHPDSDVSAYLVANGSVNVDEGAALLGGKARGGIFKAAIEAALKRAEAERVRLAAEENIKEGNEAPDFTLNDINGNPLTFSSLRGKYVLLDFWGSWCGWCIRGIPDMKDTYKKFSSKLEILGIDCQDKEEAWKEAVKEHELPWLHVVNSGDVDVAALYAVKGYPTKILVDPQGRIAHICVGEDPEFYPVLAKILK